MRSHARHVRLRSRRCVTPSSRSWPSAATSSELSMSRWPGALPRCLPLRRIPKVIPRNSRRRSRWDHVPTWAQSPQHGPLLRSPVWSPPILISGGAIRPRSTCRRDGHIRRLPPTCWGPTARSRGRTRSDSGSSSSIPGSPIPTTGTTPTSSISCSPVLRCGPSAMRPPAPRRARTSEPRRRRFIASSPTTSPCSRCGAGRATPASIPTATDRPRREATTRTHPRAGCTGDASG